MRIPVIAVLLSCLAISPLAAGQGATDYGALHGVFKASSAVAAFKRLVAIPTIQSKDPEVAAQEITIVIHARAGAIKLAIDPKGRADFPFSDELVAENPRVVSNQPAGSLRVTLVVEVKPPTSARVSYGELAQAMADVDAAMRELGQGYDGAAIEGLEFRFDPEVHAQMSISRTVGEDLLVADPQGRIFLRRELNPKAADAVIQFSAPPLQVLPRVAATR